MSDLLGVIVIALSVIALALLAYAALIERNWYRLRRVSLKVLPTNSRPIRVLHLSDLHFRRTQQRKARWLTRLVNVEADLVINTGDNLGGRGAVTKLSSALQPLAGTPGVFVNGSNDYEGPKLRNPLGYLSGPSRPSAGRRLEIAELNSALTNLGWHNINNQSAHLEVVGHQLELLGVDDPHIGKSDFKRLEAHLVGAQREQLTSGEPFRIGVAHAPYLKVLSKFADLGVSVVFCGHTHGGQICLPGGRALVTNCDLPPRYAKGVSAWQFGEQTLVLHICAGLGTSALAPFRLFCRPEAVLVELLPTN